MAKPKEIPEVNGNVLAAVNEGETPVVIKLAIPADLYAEYKELADSQSLTVAELMLHRLKRCKAHSSIRSLYFSESQLRQLEGVLQARPIESAERAISLISNLMKIRLDGFEPVPVTALQAKRLIMGAYGGNTPQDHVAQVVQTAVARATGT